MSPIDLGLVADGLLIALLAAVIGFAIQLNRKLAAWRQESGAMEQQVATLTAALVRAEAAIAQMKGIAREDVAALDAAQKKAQSLRDDLAYLNERGGALADRLEQAVRGGLAATPQAPAARPAEKPAAERPVPPAAERPKPSTADRPISNAERELLKALEAMR
ncbi:MAG: hypothetical protein JNM30_16770 [Rhodospirillales bacterium]|nr:hypothetical protein [Rhodospirillales bacterium]